MLVPGFSESARFADGLANEMTSGPFALAQTVDIVLLGDALDNPEKYEKAFKERLVVTHSAGIMAVDAACAIMALNAPEPTPLYKTLTGAAKIAFEKDIKIEEGGSKSTLPKQALELLRHPILNSKIPLNVRHFSTVEKLIQLSGAFPNGRSLFATDQDQFGFNRPDVIASANINGIFARMLKGKHNHVLFQPRDMLKQINNALISK